MTRPSGTLHAGRSFVHVTKSIDTVRGVNGQLPLHIEKEKPCSLGMYHPEPELLASLSSTGREMGTHREKIRGTAHLPHFSCANNTKINFAAKH